MASSSPIRIHLTYLSIRALFSKTDSDHCLVSYCNRHSFMYFYCMECIDLAIIYCLTSSSFYVCRLIFTSLLHFHVSSSFPRLFIISMSLLYLYYVSNSTSLPLSMSIFLLSKVGEAVEYELVEQQGKMSAINVTGPNGKPVIGAAHSPRYIYIYICNL